MKIQKHRPVSVSPGALLVAAIMASGAAVSHAAITNYGFDIPSGLTGWTPAGDASSQTTFLGVTGSGAGAVNEAALTTLSSTFGGAPVSVNNATAPTTVDAVVGLTPFSVSHTPGSSIENFGSQGDMAEASGIGQSITVSAGDVVSFKWNFITGESAGGGALSKDYGFYTWGGNLNMLASSDSSLPVANGDFAFPRGSGWQTGGFTAPSSGTFILGFGVADGISQPGADSALGVASVTVTPVPEPWAWSLVSALALGGLAVARRVRLNRA